MKRRTFLQHFSAGILLASRAERGFVGSGTASSSNFGLSATEVAMSVPLSLNLSDIPFSCAGSFLVWNAAPTGEDQVLTLSTVRRSAATLRSQTDGWSNDLLRLHLVHEGAPQPYTISATAQELRLQGTRAGEVRIRFLSSEQVALELQGCDLRLLAARVLSWRLQTRPGSWRGYDGPSGYEISVSTTDTILESYSSTQSVADELVLRGAAVGGTSVRLECRAVRENEQATAVQGNHVAASLEDWMRACPSESDPQQQAATRVAWFLFWNLQVGPVGGYRRRAVLSSKRTLTGVWSWDNLFNALAVARADAALAWDQLHVVLDHQRPDGSLPDIVFDTGPRFGFHKPPLWAWTVEQLLLSTTRHQHTARLAEVLPAIARFHDWWFRERDLLGDGVPCYLSGNDSGWDNATPFADGWPVQSPDLLAWLIVDAECLGRCAGWLGKAQEAIAWQRRAEAYLSRFLKRFVSGDELVTFSLSPTGPQLRRSTSLLTRMPLILGRRLPEPVRKRMLAELSDAARFNAPAGPASEALDSPLYDAKGYWRGPVWGASTLLLCHGLVAAGASQLARQFASRYRATCAARADFRENYDAKTGAGRDDSGMTWAAADYLLLRAFL